MMSSEQHRARAEQLRKINPKSRAAELHDLVAKSQDENGDVDKLADEYRELLQAEPDE